MNYNDVVLGLFFNPNHVGISEQNRDYKFGQFVDANQNQQIDFYVDYQSTGEIRSIRYKVKGNPYIIAGAEWMAQEVEKNNNGAILRDMSPQYWQDLFAIHRLDKQIAVSLSQAAKILYELIQNHQ